MSVAYEEKGTRGPAVAHLEGAILNTIDSPIENGLKQTTFQAPELVRVMTPEQRAAAEKKLVRKIDLRLLPMTIIMYIMNYLDRNNIAAAKLAGLQTDLNLSSVQYSVSRT